MNRVIGSGLLGPVLLMGCGSTEGVGEPSDPVPVVARGSDVHGIQGSGRNIALQGIEGSGRNVSTRGIEGTGRVSSTRGIQGTGRVAMALEVTGGGGASDGED